MFVEQKYGGHLGFYEGGLAYPNPMTWLDRLVVQLSEALVTYSTDKIKASPAFKEEQEDQRQKLSFSDGDTGGNGSTTEDDDESTFTLYKRPTALSPTASATRPTYLCRRRTVSGPHGAPWSLD